jgi:hypothetical protein
VCSSDLGHPKRHRIPDQLSGNPGKELCPFHFKTVGEPTILFPVVALSGLGQHFGTPGLPTYAKQNPANEIQPLTSVISFAIALALSFHPEI